MSDARDREWHFYLEDMIGFCEDDDTLWSVIQDDVPELLPLLKSLKSNL